MDRKISYIDKSALVAEIERRLEAIANASTENNRELAPIIGAQQYELINLVQFLDTLEVKEVDEEYNGRAMLYVLEKGVKQGRRELIENACKWWEEELSYPSMTQEEIKWYKSKVNKFRKAMEE